MSEESCFPRGKPKSKPKNTEVTRKSKDPEDADSLFKKKSWENVKTKSSTKKRKIDEEEPDHIQEELDEQMKTGSIEYLSFKKLKPGALFLGVISVIDDFELKINLPFSLFGYVKASEISAAYTDSLHKELDTNGEFKATSLNEIFDIGQLIVCAVKAISKKAIQLTIDPQVINSNLIKSKIKTGMIINGYVKSEEDHGFVIDVGISSCKAFLPKKMTDSDLNLKEWSFVRCVVHEVKSNGFIIKLSNEKKQLNRSQLDLEGLHRDHLQPGALVNCSLVKNIENQGMILKFGDFKGTVSLSSMVDSENPPANDDEGAKKKRKRKKKVEEDQILACVSYVSLEKKICLVTKPHIWDDDKRLEKMIHLKDTYPVGSLCHVQVMNCIPGIGLLCKTDCDNFGVISLMNMTERDEKIDVDDFKVGSSIKVRVLNNISLDGALNMASKKSLIKSDLINFSDLKPGQKVDCKILSVRANGLQVIVGSNKDKDFVTSRKIQGFVPTLHLSDIILKRPEKFFNENNIITCRILSVDPTNKHLHLTHKKSLVQLKDNDVISDYHKLRTGSIVQSFISKLLPSGCIVKMFNNVGGLVPKCELGVDNTDSFQNDFFIGQIVKCRVLTVDPDNEKLRLSFRLKPAVAEVSPILNTKMLPQVVDAVISTKLDHELKVTINGSADRYAYLHISQLSDHPNLNQLKFDRLQVGDHLKGLVVLSAHPLKVSLKKSLVDFAGKSEKVLTVHDLVVGSVLPGFVSNVVPYGVFVRFIGGITALCPKSKCSDEYVTSTDGLFTIGQSVICKITEIDEDTKKISASLLSSDCSFDQSVWMNNYLSESSALKGCDVSVGDVKKIVIDEETDDKDFIRCKIPGNPLKDFKTFVTNPNLQRRHRKGLSSQSIHLRKKSSSLPTIRSSNLINPRKSPQKSVSNLSKDQTSDKCLLQLKDSIVECRVLRADDVITIAFVIEVDDEDQKWILGRLLQFSSVRHPNHLKNVFKDATVSIKISQMNDQGILVGHICDKTSLKQKELMKEDLIGKEVVGVIKSVRHTHAVVSMTSLPRLANGHLQVGRLHFSELNFDLNDGDFPMKRLRAKQEVKCLVIGRRMLKSHTFLEVTRSSARYSVLELSLKMDRTRKKIKVGSQVIGVVKEPSKSKKSENLEVELIPGVEGILPILLFSNSDDVGKIESLKEPRGMAVTCIVAKKLTKNRFELVRTGAIRGAVDDQKITVGCKINVKIVEIVNDGLLVRGPFGHKGKVHITDLSDQFEDNPMKFFLTKSQIRCCVLDCSDSSRMLLSMRKSSMKKDAAVVDPCVELKDLKRGDRMRGFVKSVSKNGIFISISRSLTGRVSFNKVSKYFIDPKDLVKIADIFKPGRLVTFAVSGFSDDNSKINLSLLEKDTGVEDNIPTTWDLPLKNKKRKNSDKPASINEKKIKLNDVEDVSNIVEEISKTSLKEGKLIQVTTDQSNIRKNEDIVGFCWDEDVDKTQEATTEDQSIPAAPQLTKTEMKIQSAKEEADLREVEEQLLNETDQNYQPKSAEEWRRKIVSDPHNSEMWIKFVSFHLYSTEVEQARLVAEEALKTIDFGLIEERLNVWVALINLEIMFGNDDSVKKVVGRALMHNDQIKIYNHLISTYVERNESQKAEETHKKIVKKFRKDKQVWFKYIQFLMTQKRFDEANNVFKRSLQSIDKKFHMESISNFGRMCLLHDDVNRGLTIFEKVLSDFPKRTDIWSIYVDALIKKNLVDEAREIFSRILNLTISSKQSKSFFKRYLDFEKKYGSEFVVQEKSLEFIQRFGKLQTD